MKLNSQNFFQVRFPIQLKKEAKYPITKTSNSKVHFTKLFCRITHTMSDLIILLYQIPMQYLSISCQSNVFLKFCNYSWNLQVSVYWKANEFLISLIDRRISSLKMLSVCVQFSKLILNERKRISTVSISINSWMRCWILTM